MVETLTGTTAYRAPDTLQSDTEESVVGTQWHQNAIGALSDALDEVARRRGASWGVCNQIALLGLQHANGTAYDPRPDVMVLAQPLPSGRLSAIALSAAGTPLFIAEVASASTVGQDLGEKRQAYAAVGVAEYLVCDPDGELVPDVIRAWRRAGGGYVAWEAARDGRWHSAALGVSFAPTRPYLRVYDRDGREIAPSFVVRARVEHLEQQAERLEQQAERLEEQLRAEKQARAEETWRRAELEETLRQLRAERDEK